MGVEKRWVFALFSATSFSCLALLFYSVFVLISTKPLPSGVSYGVHHPPAFAYFISGGRGDVNRIFRLLLAVYHPRNRYLLHLNTDASSYDRLTLLRSVKSIPAMAAFDNVDVVGNPSRIIHLGSSNLAATLRAAAILLKLDSEWAWFIHLSAKDYPLVTQDDMAHAFSSISKELNFVDQTGDLGWKESHRFKPIVVDPGIYLARRSQIFYASQQRDIPDNFKVFTGSPWSVLSRSFTEFCIMGYDNLPRVLLMYFNNVILPEESYFQSVLCNSPVFRNTTVNSDIRFMMWDDPPGMEPHYLRVSDFDQIAQSGAAFARQFHKDDPVLDMIDAKILGRGPGQITPGAWCTGRSGWLSRPCSRWGNVNVLKPGNQAKKLIKTIAALTRNGSSMTSQCR